MYKPLTIVISYQKMLLNQIYIYMCRDLIYYKFAVKNLYFAYVHVHTHL